MDVRRNAFPHRLLEVLEAIADAHFVAIDLEYSGIASRGTTGARIVQTVQQRYDEVRQAADQFQVLQLGLTCAYEDPARGVYSLRPYNFDVCPLLLDRRLGLDRHFTFQSSALDFLLSHGFDVAAPFTTGVPYLSRAESLRAAQLADVRAEPDGGIEDIELGSDDVQARQFVSKVKSDIAGWLESKSKLSWESLAIDAGPGQSGATGDGGELTRFQKRLVHQLVRNEYPDRLVVVRRRENLQIRFRNEAHEKQLQAARRQRVQDDIRRHIGLRWLFEALVANGDLGDLEKIVTAPPCNPETLAPVFIEDLTTLKQRFDRVRDRFKRRPPPFLVGHNLFGDLVYLLRCFVGPLPPTVEEFCTLVRTFFPITVDTKYLATHGCGDLPPSSSLEKIEEQLQERHVPMITTHHAHSKYVESGAACHEAGYDSYLTAKVAIKLSTKLEAEGRYVDADTVLKPASTVGASSNGVDLLTESLPVSNTDQPRPENGEGVDGAAKQRTAKEAELNAGKEEDIDSGGVLLPTLTNERSRFATSTKFDALDDLLGDEGQASSAAGTPADERGSFMPSSTTTTTKAGYADRAPAQKSAGLDPSFFFTTVDPPPEGPTIGRTGVAQPQTPETNFIVNMMPPLETDFWRVYANKLRLFGTVEGMLSL